MSIQIKRDFTVKAGLLISSIFFCFVLAEIGLRFAGVAYPRFHHFDPLLGASPRPGATGWYRQEGQAYIQINSDGLRDIEHVIPKPDGVYRIAVLGDSFVEALQVPFDKIFTSVLQQELSHCPSMNKSSVEVMNFGISNFGTAQELLLLRHKVWKYNPDLILLAFFTGNDIRDNSKSLSKNESIPYFVFSRNHLVLDVSYQNNTGYQLRHSWLGADLIGPMIDHCRLLQVINRVRGIAGQWLQVREKKSAEVLAQYSVMDANTQLDLDGNVYVAPQNPKWQEAWRVTDALVHLMNQEVQDHGSTFHLVTLSNAIQVHPDRLRRQTYAKSLGINDLLYPDRRMQELAKKEHIPFLMLAPILAAWAEAHQTCMHGFDNTLPCDGHWNAYGHKLAGESIANHICQNIF